MEIKLRGQRFWRKYGIHGSFTGCASNACNGISVKIVQFTNSANNGPPSGTWTISASTATTITINNASGVSETHFGVAYSTPRFDEQTAIHGRGNAYRANLTNQCLYNVFDNSDGTLGDWQSYGNLTGSNQVGATMEGIQTACGVVAYSIFNRVSNGDVGTSESLHDNLFHDMYEPMGSVHGNIWNSDNDAMAAGAQYFYNNVFYNINEGVSVWMMSTSVDYAFNNVAWNNSNSANCYVVGGSSQSTGLPTTTLYFYNNTSDAACNLRFLNNNSDPLWNGTAYWQNDHFIGYSPAALTSTYSCDGGGHSPCTGFTDNGSELFQTEATANGQGYVQGNAYAPTLASNSTVGAGANLQSLISTFGSSFGSGTSGGCTETAANGGQISDCPAITINARSTTGGAWDIGAYLFAGGTLATPTFSPGGGSTPYVGSQVVTITLPAGATGCYTLDGTSPVASGGTCTHGTTYTIPFNIVQSETLHALASQSGFTNSPVGSAGYIDHLCRAITDNPNQHGRSHRRYYHPHHLRIESGYTDLDGRTSALLHLPCALLDGGNADIRRAAIRSQ